MQDAEAKLQAVAAQKKAVDHLLQVARQLRRRAAETKQKLLNKVFNEELNSLWADLFSRLVRYEYFLPRISKPRTVRGVVLTAIEAVVRGTDKAFEHAGAVLSTGNLNTAALSLFLALHLIEQPRHHVLVLDDPVENMDDIHVVQLAALLREVTYRAQRQLVVAVHERALFDYLCLELGPTREGEKLLAIELSRGSAERPTDVKFEYREWKKDRLLVGA